MENGIKTSVLPQARLEGLWLLDGFPFEICARFLVGILPIVPTTMFRRFGSEFAQTELASVCHKRTTCRCTPKTIQAPLTYHQFQTVVASMGPPPPAEPSITQKSINGTYTPIGEDHDDKFGVPTLEELERKAWVASFGRPKMTPQSLLASQTGLSPYLRFGCLSTRLFYYQLTDLYKKIKKACPPLSLHGQLLWREFFYCAATKNPKFDRMIGNPICVQIPWDKNAEALAKWANGQTGFPWIDAIMTQLREEGWIHHLARHAVACFLTRGDLWISWEEGMKVFEELLLDADWSVNAGMWIRYLPVLKNFPTRYIHEPWNAPESVQKAAKCIVGKEYSLPMVNHAVASRINIERMKQVYQQLSKYRGPGTEEESSAKGCTTVGLLATVPTSQSQSTNILNPMLMHREFKKSPPLEPKWERSPPDNAMNGHSPTYGEDPTKGIQLNCYQLQQQQQQMQIQNPHHQKQENEECE
ncbi:Cryptochrome-1 [Blattella germanica]|nr:Cryptochrome-1 [Blattella germanica]